MLCNKVKTKTDELRESVDELEFLVDDELWPMPKFCEMLFISWLIKDLCRDISRGDASSWDSDTTAGNIDAYVSRYEINLYLPML